MKIKQAFKALREPSLTDHMPSQDAFMYYEYALIIVGWLKPVEESRLSYYELYKFVRILMFIFTCYVPIGFFIIYFKEFHLFTISELILSVMVAFNAPAATVKSFMTFINIWRLKLLKGVLDKLDRSCSSIEEKYVTHYRVKFCNIVYLTFLFIYVTFIIQKFLLNAPRGVLPWNLFIPFINWRNDNFSFWIYAVLESLLMLVILYFNHLNDCYPVIFGMTIRLHLELLNKRIQRLRSDPNKSDKEDVEDLIRCVNDHQLIKDACNIMRPFISINFFIQFLMVGILFGLCLMGITLSTDLFTTIYSLYYACGLFLHTFPFCYICTLICVDCDNLANALFHSDWVDASRRYKLTLFYFLQITQQNITFTAGSIFDISLSNNIDLAKLAFSVITFVKQMKFYETLNKKN